MPVTPTDPGEPGGQREKTSKGWYIIIIINYNYVHMHVKSFLFYILIYVATSILGMS